MTDIALETESTPAATEAHVHLPTSDAPAPGLPAPHAAATSSDQRSALVSVRVGAGVGGGVGVGAGVMCAVDDAMDQPEPLPEALSRAADAAARSGHRFDLMRYLRLRRRP